MSCNRCAKQSTSVMNGAGVTASQTEAIFDRPGTDRPPFSYSPIHKTSVSPSSSRHTVTAIALNKGGRMHCRTCGRFVPKTGSGHICPYTGTLNEMQAAISRRTGMPGEAFGSPYIQAMMDEARKNEVVIMRHHVTGETIEATLDALPLAMATGYHGEKAWGGFKGEKTWLAASGNGQVYQVLQPPAELGLKEAAPGGAVEEAAGAYGHTPVSKPVSAVSGPTPAPTLHAVRVGTSTNVSDEDAAEYTMGRLAGSEFRKAMSSKHGYKGTLAADAATIIGERYGDPGAKSLFRHEGLYPDARNIVAGRTFVDAAYLLASGKREAVLTADGQGVELYAVEGGERGELRAVFSAAGDTWLAGDVDGSSNLSAEQVAAMTAWMSHPDSDADRWLTNVEKETLARDLDAARTGSGTYLAASDGVYIAINKAFQDADKDETVMKLGGTITSPQCPTCGRWAGSYHVCPTAEPEEEPAAADGAEETIPAYDLEHRGSWTWVKFDGKPPEDVRKAIKDLGFSYKSRDESWYARRKVSEDELGAALRKPASDGGMDTPGDSASPTRETSRVARRKTRKAADESAAAGRTPRPQTAQEFVMAEVVLPAPDTKLENVPASWGGQLERPLEQKVPTINPHYQIDESNEHVWAAMSASLQVAAQVGDNRHAAKFRSFGLYGSPAAGKNELARQLAATIQHHDENGNLRQGINYTEVNVTEKSTADELIGGAILESVDGATRSRVALGPVGQAAAMGSVIAVNEIVRSPKLATAFQSMIEDGEIIINTPEAGTVTIPVHPSTVFVFTWNPGYEGDADRPGLAALSRMTTFRMEEPDDSQVAARVGSFFNDLLGDEAGSGKTKEAARLRETYRIPPKEELMPTQAEIKTATHFWSQVRAVSGPDPETRRIGFKSLAPTAPRQRDLYRFVMLGKTIGWKDASRMFDVVCDQDEDFAAQRAVVDGLLEQNFGKDGRALHRAKV